MQNKNKKQSTDPDAYSARIAVSQETRKKIKMEAVRLGIKMHELVEKWANSLEKK